MKLILGPIIGHVTQSTARILAHTDPPAQGDSSLYCEVFLDPDATTTVTSSPFRLEISEEMGCTGVCEITLPEPNRRYYYRLSYRGQLLHNELYTFLTLPTENPDRLVFAVVSCHQPFKYSQPLGTVMWRALRAELIREQARFLLLVGDQVYGDEEGEAWQQSLKIPENDPKCFEKRLELYRNLYRQYWAFPDVRQVMANFPQYMIWDDHEITNGWGSDPEHKNQTPQNIFQAAQKAYTEFQHSHNPQNLTHPGALYYGFHIGVAAFLVLDLRGYRQIWNQQILGQAQRNWITDFLQKECSATKVLFVISSVPMFHLAPRWTWIPASDVSDQWSDERNKKDRKWILDRLFEWIQEERSRQVFILGGDVHVGTFAEAKITGTDLKIYQATSSPISNKPASLLDVFLRKVSSAFSISTESGKVVDVTIERRYPTRNFLIVTVDNTTDPVKPIVRFKMHWEGKKNPDPYPGELGLTGIRAWLRGGRFQ